jgi:hypothetical protein
VEKKLYDVIIASSLVGGLGTGVYLQPQDTF